MAIELNKLAINCRKLIDELPFIIENLLTSDNALKLINANIDSWNKGLKPNQEPIENKFTQSTWYSQTWERERKRKGRKSTILTSPLGVEEEAEVGKKTLLGG